MQTFQNEKMAVYTHVAQLQLLLEGDIRKLLDWGGEFCVQFYV